MKFVWAIILCTSVLAISRCALNPTHSFNVIWYHNGHEEYTVRHFVNTREHWTLGFAQTPQGHRLYPGMPMVCWLTNKPYAEADVSMEGSVVKAN